MRAAVADMRNHADLDGETLRHMVAEAGGDPDMVASGPRVIRDANGVPTHVVISHGPRAGEQVRIINGHLAGETVNGVRRGENDFPAFDSRYDTTLGPEHLGTLAAAFARALGAVVELCLEPPDVCGRPLTPGATS